jgi:hypothetical protein
MNSANATTNSLSAESKVVLECVVGSTVHGTSVDDGLEDIDLMAIFLESPHEFIGFSPTDTVVKRYQARRRSIGSRRRGLRRLRT